MSVFEDLSYLKTEGRTMKKEAIPSKGIQKVDTFA